MPRSDLTTARWDDLKAEIRAVLIAVARQRQTITYSELTAALQTAYVHYHSPLLTRLLVDIGAEEMQAGRPVLPAVVVAKQTGIPGAGYFRWDDHSQGAVGDPETLWRADLQQVLDYWSAH